jgi:hypothetical protein
MRKIIFFAAMLLAVSVSAQVNIANGLLAYYPFNGNANDESGNNRDFTSAGFHETDRFGNTQKALRLMSPGDKLSRNFSSYYNLDSNFTINFWVNTQGPSLASYPFSWGYGWSAGNSSSDYYVEYRTNPNASSYSSRVRFTLDDLGTGSCNVDYDAVDTTYNLGNWEMITIVRTQTTLNLYQNTVLVESVALSPSCIQNASQLPATELKLGSDNSREYVDDLMIHGRALNSQEIAYLFNLTSSWTSSPTSTEVISENELRLFPNPVKNALNIQLDENSNYALEVTDLNGKRVYSSNLSGQNFELNTAEWVQGLYLLRLIDENGKTYTQKVVKD